MSSSSNNGIVQKNNGFAIALAKLTKQDQLEMNRINSINSTILLNPSAIKNNHPVINQLYQPILANQRQDAIDLSTISISTFQNPYLLANSFQSLQPNKLHPYLRNSSASKSNSSIRTSNLAKPNFNGQLNSNQQSVIINFKNSSSTSASSSSNNSYLASNLR